MTENFDKANKILGMKTAKENVKVRIMDRLIEGGMVPLDKVPEQNGGIEGM